MPRFADTNVLLYSISKSSADAGKQVMAATILETEDVVLSTQVVGEFYVQATRPHAVGRLTHQQARDVIGSFVTLPVQSVTYPVVTAAFGIRQRFGISYWDALIIEAARAGGCTEVLSEDLSDTQDYLGVRVTNPFS